MHGCIEICLALVCLENGFSHIFEDKWIGNNVNHVKYLVYLLIFQSIVVEITFCEKVNNKYTHCLLCVHVWSWASNYNDIKFNAILCQVVGSEVLKNQDFMS